MVSPAAVLPVKIIAFPPAFPDRVLPTVFTGRCRGSGLRRQFPTGQNCGILRQPQFATEIVAAMPRELQKLDALQAPVSAGYARALLRHFGKSSGGGDKLLKD